MRLLLITLLTVGRLCESANAFEWKNSLPNTSNSCAIRFRDTAMYQQGEPVVLSAKDGSSVRVFKVVNGISQTVTNGASLTINLPVGYYFLESSNDRAGLVVLPKNWHLASWFGTETLANVNWNWPISRVYTQLQASVKRCGEACWFRIQTNDVDNPAQWDWRWADDAVNHIGSKAAVTICGAYAPPVYATNPATFFRGWTNYVTAVFTRYKNPADAGRLYFEVWNEPWVTSWSDDFQFPYRPHAASPVPDEEFGKTWTNWANYYSDLVATTEMVRVKLKSKAKLVGPSTSNLETYIDLLDVLSRRGQLKKLSVVSFHDYWREVLPADFSDFPWNVRPGKTAWSMLKDARKIIGSKPLWVDEFGMSGRSAITDARYARTGPGFNSGVMDWRTAQNRSLKQVLVYLANGVTLINPHVFYRQPDAGGFESGIDLYGWERGWRGIKPKTAAFLMLAHLTDGYKSLGMKITGNHCTTLFSKGTTYRVFMWSKEGATQAVTTPARLKDLYGNLLPEGVLPDEVCYYDISVRDAAPLLLENLP